MPRDMSKQQVAKQRSRLTVALALCPSPKPDSSEFAPTENLPFRHSAAELRVVLAFRDIGRCWASKSIPCATQCCSSGKESLAAERTGIKCLPNTLLTVPVLMLPVALHQVLAPETL